MACMLRVVIMSEISCNVIDDRVRRIITIQTREWEYDGNCFCTINTHCAVALVFNHHDPVENGEIFSTNILNRRLF